LCCLLYVCLFLVAAGWVRDDDLDNLDEGKCRLSSPCFIFRVA
jgi:hypothetical protein